MQNKIPTQLRVSLKGSERSRANEQRREQHYCSLESWPSGHKTPQGGFSISVLVYSVFSLPSPSLLPTQNIVQKACKEAKESSQIST